MENQEQKKIIHLTSDKDKKIAEKINEVSKKIFERNRKAYRVLVLESAVNNPFQTFCGEDLYPTIFDKAAQLAFGLTKNHGFVDGNKRVAIHAMEVYLFINGYDTNFSQEEIIKIGFELAEGKLSTENLSKILKDRTFEIES